MLRIQGYPNYCYDPNEGVVYSENKSWTTKKLKWYEYESGLQRVALYVNKKPYYIFANQFVQDENWLIKVVEGKKRPRASKFDLPKEVENPIEESVDWALEEEQNQIIEFFHARENRPMRKDAFVTKFSKEILERSKEILVENKTEKWTFYFLIKRLYA